MKKYLLIPLALAASLTVASQTKADWRDAVEFLLAGASVVQIGTAIAYKGLGIFEEVLKGVELYLRMMGYKSVGDVVGLSHKY